MKNALFILIGLLVASSSFATDEVVGRWKIVDNKTGKIRSVIEISIHDDKLYGKVIAVESEADKSKVCSQCKDYRKNRKILGMNIISGLRKNGNTWEGENGILNPETGKTYDCKIWVENKKLKVKGGITKILSKTMTWFKD